MARTIEDAMNAINQAMAAQRSVIDLRRAKAAQRESFVQQAIPQAMRLTKHVPNGTVPSPMDTGLGEAAFNKALQKMIAASGGKLKVTSGKRSTKRQSELWAAALKKYGSPERARKWVAPPGRSKHEQGLAADLAYADAAARQWAHANARNFGLHFPLGNEPWHVEQVGSRGGKHKH